MPRLQDLAGVVSGILKSRFYFPVPAPDGMADRPLWDEVPAGVQKQIEDIIGACVTVAEIARGGYGPSAAFLLTTTDGREFFVKGSHPRQEAHGFKMLEQETAAYAGSPTLASLAPRLLGRARLGGEDDWHLAVFERVSGAKGPLPWDDQRLEGVFHLLKTLHTAGPELPAMAQVSLMRDFISGQTGWQRVAHEQKVRDNFLSVFRERDAAQDWLDRVLPDMQALASQAPEISGPLGLLHGDLRSDNILIGRGGRFYLIDAPNACFGPVIFDLAFFLSGVSAESGRSAQDLLRAYGGVTGLSFHAGDVKKALASVLGYYAVNAGRLVPPRLPQLRWVQKQHLWGGLCWMAELLEDNFPPDII